MKTPGNPRKTAKGAGRPRAARTKLPAYESGKEPTCAAVGLGLQSAILRLRQAEKGAAEDYMVAKATRDADLIAATLREWTVLVEHLRKVESTSPDVEKVRGETVSRSKMELEIARMATAARVALESLPRSLPPRLIGLDEVAIHEVLVKGINDALEMLSTTDWKRLIKEK